MAIGLPNPRAANWIRFNPATGEPLARVRMAGPADYEAVVARAAEAFLEWRMMPAPKRGDIVREIGNELREHKQDLGALVSLEMGKILPEGRGEVQEMIDIADFAVGLSRQLYGLTMHSERPGPSHVRAMAPARHRGRDQRLQFPGGGVGVERHDRGGVRRLRALAASSETPLAAIAVQKIGNRVCDRHGLKGIFNLVIGPSKPVAESADSATARIPLVSFTGSTEVGRHVAEVIARRLGRSFWNWAATTASSSWTMRIRTWCCAPCCSARSAPPDSAAPPRAACSCTRHRGQDHRGAGAARTGRCASASARRAHA